MAIQTIMLIDDNETDQFLHEFIVQKFDPNIEIIKAYDGQEALDILEDLERAPDLILLDINMPGMNGFEFLDEFNCDASMSSVVVMLSSSNQDDDKDRAMSYECVKEYVVKPLDLEILKKLSEL